MSIYSKTERSYRKRLKLAYDEAITKQSGTITPLQGGVVNTAALGAFVRQQRKDRRLTQIDVAELAEVSDRFLRELEHGKPTVEIGKVIDVLAVLGYDLEPVVHRGSAL